MSRMVNQWMLFVVFDEMRTCGVVGDVTTMSLCLLLSVLVVILWIEVGGNKFMVMLIGIVIMVNCVMSFF
jgi:phosphotransferase system  glucose/maltose/N-acetylglucosamine-specific IIC component